MEQEQETWKLDCKAQRRLTFEVLRLKAICNWTIDDLVSRSGYSRDAKTLQHHLVDETPWTPHAVQAMAKLLTENERRLTPEKYIANLRLWGTNGERDLSIDDVVKPWLPRLRDAAAMAKLIANLEPKAQNWISYGHYPPLWLMPLPMRRRHIERQLRSSRYKDQQKQYRAGLARLARVMEHQLFESDITGPIRTVILRMRTIVNLANRRFPFYNHFTADDVQDFFESLAFHAGRHPRLCFAVPEPSLNPWEHCVEERFHDVGNVTFIDDRLCLGEFIHGFGWFSFHRIANTPWSEELAIFQLRLKELIEASIISEQKSLKDFFLLCARKVFTGTPHTSLARMVNEPPISYEEFFSE